jgi:hypothetical protein
MFVRPPVGPLQLGAPGLASWLQLKGGVGPPDALRQDVQPVVDMHEWWLRATRTTTTTAYTCNIAGPNTYGGWLPLVDAGAAVIGPGAKEWWFVHWMSVVGSFGNAAVNIQLGVNYNGGPAGGYNSRLLGLPVSPANGVGYVPFLAEGFWMPPSSWLSIYVTSVVGASNVLSLTGIEYSVLPL